MQKKTTTKNFITMAKIAKQLTELVGNTPLLQLNAYSKKENLNTNIIAKLEYFNPAGSVKDRIALAMIEDAEKRGVIKPGATIIAVSYTHLTLPTKA